MRRFRDIVEDIKAPSPQSLWLDNGKLKFPLHLLSKMVLQ